MSTHAANSAQADAANTHDATPTAPRGVVLHAGSLGDSVMVWPLLRALSRQGFQVDFVSASEKARLGARWLGEPVGAVDIEQACYALLWREGRGLALDTEATLVVSFLVEPGSEIGTRWLERASAAFPCARIMLVGAPGTPSRRDAWERFDVARLGAVAPTAHDTNRSIVMHVGAGGEAKRWALDRFIELARALTLRHAPGVQLIAGEVERERFSERERSVFASAGGRMIGDLESLAKSLAGAALVIASDTGPGHLSAQLGVPTLSLFGPTDVAVWSPIGARARVIAPGVPSPMAWLDVRRVIEEASAMLAGDATDQ